MPSQETPLPRHLHLFNYPESLRTLSLWGVMGASLHRPSVVNSTFSTIPSLRCVLGRGGEAEKSQPSDHMVGYPGNQLPSPGYPKAHQELSHQNKSYSYHPGNSKGFRSSVPDVIIQEITKVLRALCQEPRAKAT
jgi:hypothetical protein